MIPFIPFDYQESAIQFLKNNHKCALWSPMGAGKTSIALSFLSQFKKCKALIVCPYTVIAQWQSEINKFEEFNHLSYTILHGLYYESLYENSNTNLYITNYESLPKLLNIIYKSKRIKFNCIIYDESSKLKSKSTKRFKAACKLSNSVKRTILLSATPSPNSYSDLWAQYFLLDKGKRLYPSFTKFEKTYFDTNSYCQYIKTIKPNAPQQIAKAVHDTTFRITDKQLPAVAELYTRIIPIHFSKVIKRKYEILEKSFFYELAEDEYLTASNAAALFIKCRQYIQGFMYEEIINNESIIKKVHVIHHEKLNALIDLIEGFNGEPVIIAYNFRHELQMLIKQFPQAVRLGSGMCKSIFKDTVDKWNKREISIMLCNPSSVSYGLNLQNGGNNIIWYSLTPSYENYTQLIGRLHRQGQKLNVHNHILTVKNTLDEVMLEKIKHKKQSQNHFLSLINHYKTFKNMVNIPLL